MKQRRASWFARAGRLDESGKVAVGLAHGRILRWRSSSDVRRRMFRRRRTSSLRVIVGIYRIVHAAARVGAQHCQHDVGALADGADSVTRAQDRGAGVRAEQPAQRPAHGRHLPGDAAGRVPAVHAIVRREVLDELRIYASQHTRLEEIADTGDAPDGGQCYRRISVGQVLEGPLPLVTETEVHGEIRPELPGILYEQAELALLEVVDGR